jgi:hypothetical protein
LSIQKGAKLDVEFAAIFEFEEQKCWFRLVQQKQRNLDFRLQLELRELRFRLWEKSTSKVANSRKNLMRQLERQITQIWHPGQCVHGVVL